MKSALALLLLLFFVIDLKAKDKNSAETEIQFGTVAVDIPAVMIKRLTPLTEYLNNKTQFKISIHPSANMSDAILRLGSNQTQIAYLSPAAYVEAYDKYKILPLVSMSDNGQSYFNLVVVTKKNSSIKSIKDLKGKRFAFGDKKAKLQLAAVIDSGLRLTDFQSYEYLNHNDNVVKAVIFEDFDAGILLESVAKKNQADLKVIYRSKPFPSHLIAYNKNLSPKIIKKIKDALLALDHKNSKDRALVESLDSSYNGFQITNNKKYNIVREMSKRDSP